MGVVRKVAAAVLVSATFTAAWDREARCLLRVSRSRAEAPEVFEALTRRRQEIGSSRFLCSCLGYSSEWQDPRDVEGEVSDALTVLEL